MVCVFKNISWSRISSIEVGTGKLLFVKCSQALSNEIRKSSLHFTVLQILVSGRSRNLFYLKKARTRLKFRIKFNRYSMITFQNSLVDLTTFESILFLKSLIECLCPKYLVHSSKRRVKVDAWEVEIFSFPEEIVYSFKFL